MVGALGACGTAPREPHADLPESNGAPAPARAPNILLILADDIGVECFSCYGGESDVTRRVDGLAAQGMRFTAAHAQPVCTPSRVELMTGRDHRHCYEAFSVLPRGPITLAEVMRDAGYATAVAGKWQLLGAEHYPPEVRGSGRTPDQAGFDSWCLWQVDQLGERYHGPLVQTAAGTTQHAADTYGPDLYAQHLMDFMTAHRDTPFFAYFPMALVHDPFVPPPGSTNPAEDDRQAHFRAMVAYMDGIVGRLVDHVDALGLEDDTIIVFTGDNGTHRSIETRWRGRTVRGGKNTLTDRGTHVPLIVRWPDHVAAGSHCDDLIDFTDFLPTLCALANAPTPPAVDGVSFAPQLRGAPGTPREILTCFHHPRPKTRPQSRMRSFARTARFKLYDDGRTFDLATDPDESGPGADPIPPSVLASLAQALAPEPPVERDSGR